MNSKLDHLEHGQANLETRLDEVDDKLEWIFESTDDKTHKLGPVWYSRKMGFFWLS